MLWFDQVYWLIEKAQKKNLVLIENLLHFQKEVAEYSKLNLPNFLNHYLTNMTQKEREKELRSIFGEELFCESQTIGKDLYLSWNELDILCKSKLVEVGSHTMSHPLLTLCSTDEVKFELETSRKKLKCATNQDVDYLSYPNGNWSSEIVNLACQLGYRGALATGRGSLTDRFAIRRMNAGVESIWKFVARQIKYPKVWFRKHSICFVSPKIGK